MKAMSVVSFQDKIYLQYKQNWFLWEPAWDCFRPLDALVWNGTSFEEKSVSCQDPLDIYYGYGSEQMKQVCELLRDKYNPNERSVPRVKSIPIGNEWFYDRFVEFSPCASRDKQSWKRMTRGKHNTCRHAPRGKKLTRRIHV